MDETTGGTTQQQEPARGQQAGGQQDGQHDGQHDGQQGTTPGQTGSAPPRPSATQQFWDLVYRSGVRRTSDRWVGGVAGGVARRFGLDPMFVRGLWLVLCILAGAGLVLYALGWALLPDERDGRILARDAAHGELHGGLVGAGVVFLLGVLHRGVWDGWFAALAWVSLGVAAVIVVVAVIDQARRRDVQGQPGGSSGSGGSGSSGEPSPTASWSAWAAPASSGTSAPAPAAEAAAPAWTPVPETAQERAPRRRGAGRTVTAIVVGLCLLAGAAVIVLHRAGYLDGVAALVWTGAALCLVGAAIVAVGLAGRTAGGLTGLALVLGLVALPVAALTSSTTWLTDADTRAIASETTHVTSVRQAEQGFGWAVGDATVDLTDLTLPADGSTVRVPVALGAGNVRVELPAGVPVTAQVRIGAGDIFWRVDAPETHLSGLVNSSQSLYSPDVARGTTPRIELDLQLGAGQLTVERGTRR